MTAPALRAARCPAPLPPAPDGGGHAVGSIAGCIAKRYGCRAFPRLYILHMNLVHMSLVSRCIGRIPEMNTVDGFHIRLLSNAYDFAGPDGAGKQLFAQERQHRADRDEEGMSGP